MESHDNQRKQQKQQDADDQEAALEWIEMVTDCSPFLFHEPSSQSDIVGSHEQGQNQADREEMRGGEEAELRNHEVAGKKGQEHSRDYAVLVRLFTSDPGCYE